LCSRNYCSQGGNSCDWANTTCTPPDNCYTATCDPKTGCIYTAKNCDDGKGCTIDSCDKTTGSCKNDPIVCTAVDACSTSVCDDATALCQVTTLGDATCDDGVDCTVDYCDPVKGCLHNLTDVLCDLQDQCHNYTCTATGCAAVNVVCPDDGLFCTNVTCVDYQGCVQNALNCSANSTASTNSSDCSTIACSEEKSQCAKTEQACTVWDTPTILAVTLTAAAIAGIIVAAVVGFVACAGGASYAVYQRMNTGSMDAIVNNPLYKNQGREGLNPLFKNT